LILDSSLITMALLSREILFAMRWKFSPLLILTCCVAGVVSARPQSGQRGVSLIVVPTESNAMELRSRIRSGESFEALAITYSTDPTAARAGYMGMMDAASLRQEFRGALEELPSGAVSPVTRVRSGFALLKWATADEDRWRSQHENAQAVLQQGRYAEAASLFLGAIRQA
jgi:parvulin-like peptidyl-prolyl isomerase